MKQSLIVAAVAISISLVGCANNTEQSNVKQHRKILPHSDLDDKQESGQVRVITVENMGVNNIELENLQRKSSAHVTAAANQSTTIVPNVVMELETLSAANSADEVLMASQPVMKKAQSVGSVQPNVYIAANTENYISEQENTIKYVDQHPVSTFSVDVDTASYSNVRRMLDAEGRMPPHGAVKIEEMINYFNYEYPTPDSLKTPFSVTTEIAQSPWNKHKHLLQIGLKGYQPAATTRPAANLVFLVDVSGSMQDTNKLPLVKRSLKLLTDQMRPRDRIALVVYAGAAGLVLDSTAGNEKQKILRAIDNLQAGGSTNGSAGLNLAYEVAAENFQEQGINRVIIASDGDMNVGISSIDALKTMIEQKRESGIALTTLGFGVGNYNYALMEQMADVGNGNAAYIDSIKEAQKVLVTEMQSTLLTIAKDVKIQIEFNPEIVAQYRLVGYENRVLNREDFRNDRVDAGDIGAGHTVTAFYEITLINNLSAVTDPLRYNHTETTTSDTRTNFDLDNEIAFVRLRYKNPDEKSSQEITRRVLVNTINDDIASTSTNMRFAASVAGFGQILTGGKHTGQWSLDDVVELAQTARGIDQYGYRAEFIRLVELAKSMSTNYKSG